MLRSHFLRTFLWAVFLAPAFAQSEVTAFSVLPSRTDGEIHTFNTPHVAYVDRSIVVDHNDSLPKDRHELLVWLPGTGGKAGGAVGFLHLAAELGYHVVSLAYPDEIPATTCDGDSDPQAFEKFRMAIIQGGSAAIKGGRETLSIERSESIENRLLKLLLLLQELRPREQWGQFLDQSTAIKWDSIAVAGQSQGGGHAALIGIKHSLERVLCFGAPKDFSIRLNAPAAWYAEPSATVKDRFFAFNHVQDPKGCTPEQLYSNLRALYGDSFGTPVHVDDEPFPYHHARVLYTSFPVVTVSGQESEGAIIAHNSAINTANADRWKAVWTYILTDSSG